MTDEEKKQKKLEARRKYDAEYRAKNREKINSYARNWRKVNPDKVKANKEAYWDRKAEVLHKETEDNKKLSEKEFIELFAKADDETKTKIISILGTSENQKKSDENK